MGVVKAFCLLVILDDPGVRDTSPSPRLGTPYTGGGGGEAEAWLCACALSPWPPPRVPVTGTAGRARATLRRTAGGGGRGGGERCARARKSPGREQGVRVLVCSLASRRRSPRRWEGQGRACASHVGAGRGLGRGRAAGEGRRRGVSERRGRGRAQQLLSEHFLTQQSPCAGRAAPRRL